MNPKEQTCLTLTYDEEGCRLHKVFPNRDDPQVCAHRHDVCRSLLLAMSAQCEAQIVLWFLLGVTSSAVAGCVACSTSECTRSRNDLVSGVDMRKQGIHFAFVFGGRILFGAVRSWETTRWTNTSLERIQQDPIPGTLL